MIKGLRVALGAAALVAGAAQAGYISVAQEGGRWWLVDADGTKFLSRGVDVVVLGPAPAKVKPSNPEYSALRHYPTPEAFMAASLTRFAAWGFNTVGGHSDTRLVAGSKAVKYAIALWLGGQVGVPWADPVSPEALKTYDELVAEAARPEDPRLIGYFTDNELGWWDETVFTYWTARPWTERLKRIAWNMLDEEYHGDLRRFQVDFEVAPAPASFADLKGELKSVALRPGRRPLVMDRFIGSVAEDYYAATARAVRKRDRNHLLLGDRYLSWYSQPVARAAGRHVDVVSTNYNTFAKSGWISPSFFETLYRLSRKPLMVTEYYFAAMENASGNRNRSGPFMVVGTQAARTAGAREMTERLARVPTLVGWHWFQYTDEPRFGRGDGEDFNFGLVDIFDRPYPDLVRTFAEAHQRLDALHREGGAAGLAADGGGWTIPRVAGEPAVDGALDEWDLPASWAPGPVARTPYEPFGDAYLAWSPEGLLVGAVFMDFSTGPADAAEPASLARVSVAVERDGAEPLVATLAVLPAPKGKSPVVAPVAESGTKPDRRAGLVRSSRGATSLTTVVEVLVPREALGGKRLKAGERLRAGVSIRPPGNNKETAWPRPWGGPFPKPRHLAVLTLGARGGS